VEFLEPRPLQTGDPVAGFDCGSEALNSFLERFAFQSQQSQSAKTYVTVTSSGEVAGYYTLAFGSVEHGDAPERTKKGLPKHPVPVMILARLGVARKFHGQGLGKHLLRDALLRTLQAADIAGLRAVVVQAKDDGARLFYERYLFEPFPADPLKLALLLKDLRALVAAA
jgi:GNAT superfamily N-acetyltransferase